MEKAAESTGPEVVDFAESKESIASSVPEEGSDPADSRTMELLDKTTRAEREAMEREIEAAEQDHARHLNAIRARYRARNGLQGWNEDATSDRETWQNFARSIIDK